MLPGRRIKEISQNMGHIANQFRPNIFQNVINLSKQLGTVEAAIAPPSEPSREAMVSTRAVLYKK